MTTYEELRTSLQYRKDYYEAKISEGQGGTNAEERYGRLERTAKCLREKIEKRDGPVQEPVSVTMSPKDASRIGAHGTTLETNIRIISREVRVRFSLKH